MHDKSKSLDQSIEDEVKIMLGKEKKIKFIERVKGEKHVNFTKTWLNKVTDENRKEIEEQITEVIGNSKAKFKYLFQIPQIINDPKMQQRKKTYETFIKNSKLEQYYLQLKKASGMAKSISAKANYKDVLSQISNNKVQDTYIHQYKSKNGLIYANEFWSLKTRNQIYEQSRLKELSELMEMNKIKTSYDEQLMQFENYFQKKLKPKKQSVYEMKQILASAFETEYLQSPTQEINEQQKNNLIGYFKSQNESLQTLDNSTKNSRLESRNTSQLRRPQSQEFSFFSRRASTSQLNQRHSQNQQIIISPNERIQKIVYETQKETSETKNTVKRINNFLKNERHIQEQIEQNKTHKFMVRALNNAIKMKKNRESNSHIVKIQNNDI